MQRFPAPWDRALRWTTALAVIAVAGASLFLLWSAEEELRFLLGPIGLLLLAVPLGAWLLAPVGYRIEDPALWVERRLRPVRIPLAGLEAVELLPDRSIGGLLRIGGSGGLFGWFGSYWSSRFGALRMYATRTRDLVLVDSAAGRFVLSPSPPLGFVEALLSRAPQARRGLPSGAPRRMPRSAWLPLALLAAGLPLLVGTILAAAWAYGPCGAKVGAEAVVVERNWAGPLALPFSTIREARRVEPAEWRGLRRTAGTAMGSVAYGRFESPALGRFQLYAWRRGDGLLLETGEGRVVLTPEEPDRFLAELRARLPR